MTGTSKLDVPTKHWDRLFAPSSCLAMITTVDKIGRINAASYGTCTRVNHEPVYIAFTTGIEKDTYHNIRDTQEFVVNLPSFDRGILEKVRVIGLPFARGVNELEKAGLTALPSKIVKSPRILECPRHFECKVEWVKEWLNRRVMVVGKVVAASVDADCIDGNGYVVWDRVKSAHYCGAPYKSMFVAAYQTIDVGLPYEGPEVALSEKNEKSMYKEA